METRKENGESYPPKTILNLSGLLRYMRDNKKDAFNMDNKDPVFLQLHKVLDSFFRLLHSDGIGTKPCHSEVISQEEEELLRSKGVLETDSHQKPYFSTAA